tara:strand:- start:3255 stop:3500 length:246 start_codon:yes stop_codon:yes gene_type:complete
MNIHEKLSEFSTTKWSKVDAETSDIFFNFGCEQYKKIDFATSDLSKQQVDLILLDDAKNFLEIVCRDYQPEDLVHDFNLRL